jgi:hypothetical protein
MDDGYADRPPSAASPGRKTKKENERKIRLTVIWQQLRRPVIFLPSNGIWSKTKKKERTIRTAYN